jgi:hypothetical protein
MDRSGVKLLKRLDRSEQGSGELVPRPSVKRISDRDHDLVFESIDSPRETLGDRVEQRARMKGIVADRKAQRQVAA